MLTMVAKIFTFIVWLVICLITTLCYGQQAVIEGPKETMPGQLTVLSAEKSQYQKLLWIIPKTLGSTIVVDNNTKLVLATPNLGPHEIILVASSDKGDMSYIKWVIEVKATTPPPPVEPTPDPVPDTPPPPPPGNYQQITDISVNGAKALNDPTTAKDLAAVIRSVISKYSTAPLQTAQNAMVIAIETVLYNRTGTSRDKAWVVSWRQPLQIAIDKIQITSTSQYFQVMEACARGLDPNAQCVNCK